MPLSASTSVKDQIANIVWSVTAYASLGTGFQQTLIDKWTASVLTEIETFSQWFTYAPPTGNAPVEFEPWYVDECVARIERNAHPDRYKIAREQADRAMLMAVESYTRLALTYSPGTTTEAFIATVQNIRNYVLDHCIRLRPRLLPTVASVDAQIDAVLTMVWNKANWPFKRRPVHMLVTRTTFTGGTWTESSRTISGLTGISASIASGTPVYITDGTGANTREFIITSSTSTTLVLNESLGSDADGQTDIAGFYLTVTFEGLQSGESLDALASVRWYFTDANYETQRMCWLTADDFAKVRSKDQNAVARPYYFRTHQVGPTTTAWRFSPIPDTDYVLRGEVFVRQPTAPTNPNATTTFDAFAREFMPAMRKLVLARVLVSYNRANVALTGEANDEMESLFAIYAESGDADAQLGVTDVYRDLDEITGGTWFLGRGS